MQLNENLSKGGMMMRKTKKMILTAFISAITTVSSSVVYIPVGFTKIFPVQHFVNILSAVILGPVYAVLQAFITLLRNMLGTAVFCSFQAVWYVFTAYLFKNETIGWAVLRVFAQNPGAMACIQLPYYYLVKDPFGFIPAIFSSFGGAMLDTP